MPCSWAALVGRPGRGRTPHSTPATLRLLPDHAWPSPLPCCSPDYSFAYFPASTACLACYYGEPKVVAGKDDGFWPYNMPPEQARAGENLLPLRLQPLLSSCAHGATAPPAAPCQLAAVHACTRPAADACPLCPLPSSQASVLPQ